MKVEIEKRKWMQCLECGEGSSKKLTSVELGKGSPKLGLTLCETCSSKLISKLFELILFELIQLIEQSEDFELIKEEKNDQADI